MTKGPNVEWLRDAGKYPLPRRVGLWQGGKDTARQPGLMMTKEMKLTAAKGSGRFLESINWRKNPVKLLPPKSNRKRLHLYPKKLYYRLSRLIAKAINNFIRTLKTILSLVPLHGFPGWRTGIKKAARFRAALFVKNKKLLC
jgi:hypothetical protein